MGGLKICWWSVVRCTHMILIMIGELFSCFYFSKLWVFWRILNHLTLPDINFLSYFDSGSYSWKKIICDTVTGEVCLHLIDPLTPPRLYFPTHLFSVYNCRLCFLHVILFICAMRMPHMISKHVHMIPFPAVISLFYILFFVICSVTLEVISCQQDFR